MYSVYPLPRATKLGMVPVIPVGKGTFLVDQPCSQPRSAMLLIFGTSLHTATTKFCKMTKLLQGSPRPLALGPKIFVNPLRELKPMTTICWQWLT